MAWFFYILDNSIAISEYIRPLVQVVVPIITVILAIITFCKKTKPEPKLEAKLDLKSTPTFKRKLQRLARRPRKSYYHEI